MKRRITALFAATLMALSMLAVPAMAFPPQDLPGDNCVGWFVAFDAQAYGPNSVFGPNGELGEFAPDDWPTDAPGIGNMVNVDFDIYASPYDSVQSYMNHIGNTCS